MCFSRRCISLKKAIIMSIMRYKYIYCLFYHRVFLEYSVVSLTIFTRSQGLTTSDLEDDLSRNVTEFIPQFGTRASASALLIAHMLELIGIFDFVKNSKLFWTEWTRWVSVPPVSIIMHNKHTFEQQVHIEQQNEKQQGKLNYFESSTSSHANLNPSAPELIFLG